MCPLPRHSSLVPLLVLSFVAAATAQGPAVRVDDLAVSADPSAVYVSSEITVLGSRLFFWGGHLGGRVRDLGGLELWASDGTANGTRLLFDVLPGGKSSTDYGVTAPVALGGHVYFGACDDLPRCRLWKSDGIEDAEAVIELEPEGSFAVSHQISRTFRLAAGKGRLYFTFPGRRNGISLWTSDGTAAGTRRLAAVPSERIEFPDALQAEDRLTAVFDGRLWTSDGTALGTHEVADLHTTGTPRLAISGDLAYLQVWDGNGYRLWVSDGTAEGTRPLLEDSLVADELVPAGNGRCFALSPNLGDSLWITDGTPEGTRVVTRERSASKAAVMADGQLYYAGRGGDTLARVDATGSGVTELLDNGLRIDRLVRSGDFLYLVTQKPGVPADVVRRWPLGGPSSSVRTLDNDLMYLDEAAGVEGSLAVTDRGRLALVEEGSHETRIVQASTPASSWPRNLTATGLGDDLLFATWTDPSITGGSQVYLVRDGAANLLREYPPPWVHATTRFVRALGRTLVLSPDLEAFDEVRGTLTPLGANESPLLSPLPESGAEINGRFYFGHDGFSEDDGIWQFDGEEVTLVKRLDLGNFISEAPYLLDCHRGVAVGSAYYFFFRGLLWTIHDGRAEKLLDHYEPFAPCVGIAPRGENLYFFQRIPGDYPDVVTWLYRSDGTPQGTFPVKELDHVPSWIFQYPESEPVWLGGRLFFTSADEEHGRELWSSDGTPEGTALFADLQPGRLSSSPRHLTVLDGRLYFAADDGTAGHELWATDGTPEGTVLVADVAPGAEPSYPQALTAIDGRLLFSAMGSREQGLELWISDGTAVGTRLLQDIEPGPSSSDPSGFTAAGGTVYFEAGTEGEGFELWAMPRDVLQGDPPVPPPPPPPPPEPSCPDGTACLVDGRFEVQVEWRNPRTGSAGAGLPIPFSDESVLFWFFSDGNVELIVKILDGRRINGYYWVFYGGLSDVEYWITVTDSQAGAVREYHNPPGRICGGSDTTAFD